MRTRSLKAVKLVYSVCVHMYTLHKKIVTERGQTALGFGLSHMLAQCILKGEHLCLLESLTIELSCIAVFSRIYHKAIISFRFVQKL